MKKSKQQKQEELEAGLVRLKRHVRLNTLTLLRQKASEGITIDVAALDEMIDEIQKEAVVRPKELAVKLGVKPKKVRDKLRYLYPDHPKNSDWILTPEMADAVKLALQG
jgi:hypothetical protein